MKHSISGKIVWVLSVVLVASITIFESYTWGKYILILVSFCILFIDILKSKGHYFYKIGYYQLFLTLIIIYTLVGSIWAISKIDIFSKTVTFVQILICMTILYNHYIKDYGVNTLWEIVKWASYCISIYSIIFYGFDYVIKMITSGVRLDNSYTNVNTIGMIATIGIIIQIDEMLRKKKLSISIIFCIPSFLMVIATQSRKALIMLVVGGILSLIFHNISNKKILINILKVFLILIMCIIGIRVLSSIEIFKGINERLMYIVAAFTGNGTVGASFSTRQKLIELGWSIFKEHPLVGIGIGCPHVIANQVLNFDAYLHNGFVEILAGGGIIGFILYYSSYVYIFYNLFKYRNYKDESYVLCVILALIFLFRDYAMVSMYSKITYFYFLIFFIYIQILKRRKRDYYLAQKKEC